MDLNEKLQKYAEDARLRAGRRKSLWNLLLLLHWPLAAILWYWQVDVIYRSFSHSACTQDMVLRCLPERGGAVTILVIGPMLPAIAVSMLLTNLLLWLIPPVRRIFDREAEAFPETKFGPAQRKLLLASVILVLFGDGIAAWSAMAL